MNWLGNALAENAGLPAPDAAGGGGGASGSRQRDGAAEEAEPQETMEELQALQELMGGESRGKRTDPSRPGRTMFLIGKCVRGNETIRTRVVAKEVRGGALPPGGSPATS